MKRPEMLLHNQRKLLSRFIDLDKKEEQSNKQTLYHVPNINIQRSAQPPSVSKHLRNSALTLNSDLKIHSTILDLPKHNDDISLSAMNKRMASQLLKNIDFLFKQLFFEKKSQTPFLIEYKPIHYQPKRQKMSKDSLYNTNFNCLRNWLQLEGRRLSPNELKYSILDNHQTTPRQQPTSRQDKVAFDNIRLKSFEKPVRSQSNSQLNHQQQKNGAEEITLPLIHKEDMTERQNAIKSINTLHQYSPSPVKDDLSYYALDFNYYIIHPENCGSLIKKCMSHRLNWKESQTLSTSFFNFQWSDCSNKITYPSLSSNPLFKQCVNHYEHHSSLSNKANMFLNLLAQCEKSGKEVFQYIPFTVILNQQDQSFYDAQESFKKLFSSIQSYLYSYEEIAHNLFSRRNTSYISLFPLKEPKLGLKTNIMIPQAHYDDKNIWVFKTPHLNRGRGIKLINSVELLMKYIKQSISGNLRDYSDENDNKIEGIGVQALYHSKTIILQKYIEKPLLYFNRKFDIRIWVLITHKYEVYAFREGHLKTCSVDYDPNDINSYAHITNYSLQKYNKHFSKYEKGNEVSFEQFQRFFDEVHKEKVISIKDDLFPKFKEIIELTALSAKKKLNAGNRQHCFEIFGYDFMMDELCNIYLIEINTNPGLEESSELIKVIVPRMIDDALRLTVDVLFDSKYSEDFIDKESRQYVSPYKVGGYDDKENLWELVCDLNQKAKKEDVIRIRKVKIKRKGKEKKEKKNKK